ncbi:MULTISPECIES: hypothetical protein [Rhodomicrobium]|uniref:hypothetical protein n=1 Tax=Rhodomicrobium TaxID=1068 RepID=UPI000B4A8141|nr:MULTISPECIES: hypothetical protein [Rhodomicrobium]
MALQDVLAARAGRICPADYATDPARLARAADFNAETLYVVGGLYGNALALDAIEALAADEPRSVTIVFNGDAHWFDAEPGAFRDLDARLARYPAIRGNIECEIARAEDIGAGCGCAYPVDVSDAVVARSNAILERLKAVAGAEHRARFAALPPALVADVGGLRVGIVHGDAASIAGWRFARETLDAPNAVPWLNQMRAVSRVDIFASTHTCAAVMRDFPLPSGRLTVANNGASGMGNFSGETSGLLTRISVHPCPHTPRYGVRHGNVAVDAIAIPFDADGFLRRFDAIWPAGSPAQLSYRARISGEGSGPPLGEALP